MRRLLVAVSATLLLLGACSSQDDDPAAAGGGPNATSVGSSQGPAPDYGHVQNPTVTPAVGGTGQAAGGLRYDVTQFGYQEKEFFFDGTAKTYPPSDLAPAAYRSRMIVWTPTDPGRFNGTTVVEWAQVSDFGQFELTIEINLQSTMLEQRGYAFALVSAEEGGVCDLNPNGCTATSLKGADPARYGSLNHPGDVYSFDIFSQALQAIKHPAGTNPLDPLETRTVIAEGFQSSIDKWFPVGSPNPAGFTSPFSIYGSLNAYLANGADDDARLADGFLIDGAAPLNEPTHYRVPTLHYLDESAIRRTPTPDGTNHVTWEVVGAPHADRWAGDHIRLPSASPPPKLSRAEEEERRDRVDNFGQVPDPAAITCAPGPKTGSVFPRRFALNAALVALDEWVRTGEAAPAAERIERVGPAPDTAMKKLVRDPDGNAVGGLRSPIIEVPVATYDGEGCVEAGTMTAYTPERLAELYPTHESYVSQLLAATDDAVTQRFLTCQDAGTIMRKASASTIGGPDPFTAAPSCA